MKSIHYWQTIFNASLATQILCPHVQTMLTDTDTYYMYQLEGR